MINQRVFSRGLVLAILGAALAACGGEATDTSTSELTVPAGSTTAERAAEREVPSVAMEPNTTSPSPECPLSTSLIEGQAITGQSLGEGPVSAACMPSDAGQRFFSVVIPPGMQGIVRATPTDDSVAASLVVRVLPDCSAVTCEQVHFSAAPGIQAVATVFNPGVVPRHRVVTVSGMSATDQGQYAVTLEVMPME